ncbi:MAG: hypothetical protein Q8R02_21220 [Hyphomonadaceae bacterium]|nr:hypothetical protein [Hyphomonadaceae bacterium]
MTLLAPSIAAAVIATVFFAYLIVKMALQHEEKRLAIKAGKNELVEQILAETQAEMAKLRERVQVLERLATDEDRRVASEISRLGAESVRG